MLYHWTETVGYNLLDYRTTVAIIQKSLRFQNCTTQMMQLSVLVFLRLRIIRQWNLFYSVVHGYCNTKQGTDNNSCFPPLFRTLIPVPDGRWLPRRGESRSEPAWPRFPPLLPPPERREGGALFSQSLCGWPPP